MGALAKPFREKWAQIQTQDTKEMNGIVMQTCRCICVSRGENFHSFFSLIPSSIFFLIFIFSSLPHFCSILFYLVGCHWFLHTVIYTFSLSLLETLIPAVSLVHTHTHLPTYYLCSLGCFINVVLVLAM